MNLVGSQQLAVDVPLFVIGKESACLTFNFHIIVNRSREGGGRWQRREITHTHTQPIPGYSTSTTPGFM